jgi:hypothetical protein
MAAPKGNKNGIGNRGGKSLNDRKLAAEVRSLALSEMKEILLGDDNKYKRQIILKLATSILPRLNEHTGEDGQPIPILATMNVQPHNGHNQDSQPHEANTGDTGRNVSQ